MFYVVLSLLTLGLAPAELAALPAAADVLQQSLDYHDPRGVWSSQPLEITAEVRLAKRLADERGYSVRTDRIFIDNATGQFRYHSVRGTEETQESGAGRWRDYFTYVFGVPMKLRDPGTILDPTVTRTTFVDRDVYALRVTYSTEVGADTWYFYFNPETFALEGCRFFHDEAAKDGEYIVYEGEIEGPGQLRLPRRRLWHMNLDGEYIAVDEISSIK
jgi:hypothetical protein